MSKHDSEWSVPEEGVRRRRATNRTRGIDRGEAPGLTTTSEGELREGLKEGLKQLSEEEREISYRRRVNQGRVDLMRAEFVWRDGVGPSLGTSPKELARVVLLGGRGSEGEGFSGGFSGGSGPSAGSPGSGGGG
jgi:hypothetical protein